MTYYSPIQTVEGYILSVDKVAIDYKLRGPNEISALGRLINNLDLRYAVKTAQWESYKIGRYRQNFTVSFQNGNSWWLGVALNSIKTEWQRVRLEVNPNKCAQHASFLEVLAYLNGNSRPQFTTIKRFDLAVDIPVEREKARLIKDGRVYSERQHGKNWTEYLGAQASHVGRVKLYNKQAEAGLTEPLTRLEITLDPATPYEKIKFPTVYYIETMQVSMEEQKVTDTERFIVGALLQGYGAVTDLGRKTREKITRLLEGYVKKVEITQKDYEKILKQVRGYMTGEAIAEATDKDQAPRKGPETPAWVTQAEQAERTELV